ncbi:MAG: 4Fe-4S dicluster domain-containing protein [Clostridiales bacterium]|nr:4Fe-4S dicluster domain-containing protein [Clostridiales bacterium]
MNIREKVRLAGVVGAGGAGFPTHAKLSGRAELVIANGAECEPLLRCDRLLMEREAERIVRGLELAMEATEAKRGVIATKAHYEKAAEAMARAIAGHPNLSLHLMEAYYPSGDEKSIVYEVTGRVVKSGQLPLDEGCVVSNVATLAQVADACEGKPVTRRAVTVGGAVPDPVTLSVPIGTAMREVIAHSGFSGREEDYALIVGGPCMGRLETDWGAPVTKTTGGLLLFPKNHPMILRRTQTPERMLKIARAVCCQCSQCTQLCPRNALGLGAQPHKAMRAMTTGNGMLLGGPEAILGCSSCGLCTNYACPMGLAPSEVMALYKQALGAAGIRPAPEAEIRVDPFLEYKRVPTGRLIARMGLAKYDRDAPWQAEPVKPEKVVIPLRQHIGKAAEPAVRTGDTVQEGNVIGKIPAKALSARVHASISGRVTRVTEGEIEITGGEAV